MSERAACSRRWRRAGDSDYAVVLCDGCCVTSFVLEFASLVHALLAACRSGTNRGLWLGGAQLTFCAQNGRTPWCRVILFRPPRCAACCLLSAAHSSSHTRCWSASRGADDAGRRRVRPDQGGQQAPSWKVARTVEREHVLGLVSALSTPILPGEDWGGHPFSAAAPHRRPPGAE